MPNDLYKLLFDGLQKNGSVTCNIVGRTCFVADEFRDVFSLNYGIPRLYLDVDRSDPAARRQGAIARFSRCQLPE